MPAQSKQQQKFMGLVHAIQKGDIPASDASPEAQKVAQDMKPSDVKDFASTSHTGLPRKVKQEILKKLKEYAMTLPGHHAKSAAPMEPLRSDYEMDLQKEDRTVNVYIYIASASNKKETIDEYIKKMAIKKNDLIKKFETAMREVAIDCKKFNNDKNIICE